MMNEAVRRLLCRGTKLKVSHVSFDGECWGSSGPTVNVAQMTRLTGIVEKGF